MARLPRTFDHFPDHRRIAENILRLLREDARVLGVYLSGSFVAGKPDRYSDLDLYVVVRKECRERIKQDHSSLRAKVGELISDFPATHMGDPNQIICLYSEPYPVHVDYQYRAPEELVPRVKDRSALVFWDSSGELRAWKKKCAQVHEAYAPTAESVQYFEDRFWTWCIYADSKIRRGELWEARDMIEYLRNKVIVPLMSYSLSLPLEGNRRIEDKFSDGMVSALKATLQRGHSRSAYAGALSAIVRLYLNLVDGVTHKFHLGVRRREGDGLRTVLGQRKI
jgi:predicted nucleotidyltransferase